ncbi:MAG: pirin family protein [Alphaproteobacteria bacterium]
MADHGWLQSAHSFSFADYHDPHHVQFENLRVINDDLVAAGKGFGEHPHRDFEIFSYILEGALEHKDSMGNGSIVPAGGVQYMSAGSGVTHSEFNPSATERVRLLQIWLLPNVMGEAPQYDTLQIADADKDGRLKLFLSPDGRDGSIQFKANADIYAATLTGDQMMDFDLRGGRRGWTQVARGSLTVNGQALHEGDGLAVTESGVLQFTDGKDAEILLFDLEAQ